MVLCENWHFSQILHFVVILAAISRVKYGLGCQISYQLSIWTWSIRFKCANWKYFMWGLTGAKNMYFFGLKSKICYLWWDTPICSLYVCRMVQGFQIFKQNWIILICSRVIAFLVIWCPHGPHIIPVIPMSSLLSPHCPHIVPVIPMLSTHPHIPHTPTLWSPCCLCYPHVIPIIPMSSPHHLHGPHLQGGPPRTS